MPCVVVVLALLVPRVVMFFIWLLTTWFTQAFQSWWVPLLGFLFMPYTTLAYMAAMLSAGQVSGWWLALVIFAALVDAGHWGGGGRTWRRRRIVVVKGD